jgi:chromosome segregation ATPase
LDAATSERDKTLAAVANTRNQLSGLQQQADADAKSLASLQEQSDAAAKNLAALQQQATEASTTLAGLQAKIQTAQNQLDAATSERDKTLAAVANTRNQLSGLQQQADAAAKSLAGLQEQSGAAAKNLAALQQQDTEASATLAGLQAKTQTAQNQWDAATSERDKTLAAVANAKNQLSDLEQQTDAAAKSLAGLQEQSGATAKNLAALQQQDTEASAQRSPACKPRHKPRKTNGTPRQASATRRSRPSPTPKIS